jgi:transcription initiation factor TFIID TATA-box-binding protein
MEQEGRQVSSMADRIVENIVVTASLPQKLPLQTLAVSINNTEFHDEEPVLIFRFNDPKRAVLLTEQGLITCTGVKEVQEGKDTILQVITMLKDHSIPVQEIPEVSVQSYVISITYERMLDLNEMKMKLPTDQIIYQPEKNPWLEYLYDEHVTFLIGNEGRIICIGTGSIDHAHQAINTLLKIMG